MMDVSFLIAASHLVLMSGFFVGVDLQSKNELADVATFLKKERSSWLTRFAPFYIPVSSYYWFC